MRTLARTCLAALLLVLGAAAASASTITVVWQDTGTTTTSPGGNKTADIVLAIGAGDTPIGGAGAGIRVSADYTTGAGSYVSSAQVVLTDWLPLGTPTDDGVSHVDGVIAQLEAFGYGQVIAAGESVTIGTITVNTASPGFVLVWDSGPSDTIAGNSTAYDIGGEFAFIGGTIIPEPASAGLLGLGLLALTAARRRRKN